MGRLGWTATRVARHARWARDEGVGRLVEEDGLDPRERVRLAARRWRWRRVAGGTPGSATAVFVVGAQRSGSNMIFRCLERSPEAQAYNENHRRAFDRFQLRDDDTIRKLVTQSRHRVVAFKPLCDSHRVGELLDQYPEGQRAAIWIYRDPDSRARSAVAKFGDANLRALADIAAGRGDHLWQAQGLTDDNRAFVESFDYDTMTAESGAALFWYVRNSLFFDAGLDRRSDVVLAEYDAISNDPYTEAARVCRFVGVRVTPDLVGHVRATTRREPLAIDDRIRARCDELWSRLERHRVGAMAAAESA